MIRVYEAPDPLNLEHWARTVCEIKSDTHCVPACVRVWMHDAITFLIVQKRETKGRV